MSQSGRAVQRSGASLDLKTKNSSQILKEVTGSRNQGCWMVVEEIYASFVL